MKTSSNARFLYKTPEARRAQITDRQCEARTKSIRTARRMLGAK